MMAPLVQPLRTKRLATRHAFAAVRGADHSGLAMNGRIPYIIYMLTTAPNQDQLYETAAAQQGLFTVHQAALAGYSSHLVLYHAKSGNFQRVQRGVYRLTRFPAGDQEDLVALWLWSERLGVFSHATALNLLDLSDALPAQVHMTLPVAWRRSRLKVPGGVRLYFANVDPQDRTWVDAVPVTAPLRTITDCVATHVPADQLQQAAAQVVARGLASADEVRTVLHEAR